jgi:hypothetical protein
MQARTGERIDAAKKSRKAIEEGCTTARLFTTEHR